METNNLLSTAVNNTLMTMSSEVLEEFYNMPDAIYCVYNPYYSEKQTINRNRYHAIRKYNHTRKERRKHNKDKYALKHIEFSY